MQLLLLNSLQNKLAKRIIDSFLLYVKRSGLGQIFFYGIIPYAVKFYTYYVNKIGSLGEFLCFFNNTVYNLTELFFFVIIATIGL